MIGCKYTVCEDRSIRSEQCKISAELMWRTCITWCMHFVLYSEKKKNVREKKEKILLRDKSQKKVEMRKCHIVAKVKKNKSIYWIKKFNSFIRARKVLLLFKTFEIDSFCSRDGEYNIHFNTMRMHIQM